MKYNRADLGVRTKRDKSAPGLQCFILLNI
jgi:hypothetical protein